MNTFVPILIFAALGSVVTVMVLGFVDLARGKPDRTRSNKLMQLRVVLQGIAILIILIAVLIARGQS